MEKIFQVIGEKTYFLKNTPSAKKIDQLTFELNNDQSTLTLLGIFNLVGESAHSLKIKVIHKAPQSQASLHFISILDQGAQLKLKSQTIVESNAIGSNETLLHHSFLLDDHSQSYTIPEQEISAENCECSHDLVIENLDQKQLQYLISKGISLNQAQKIYLESFSSELLEKIKNSQKEDILLSF